MALDTFQTYKYHELLNKEYSLYKVSKDGLTFGITNSPFVNGAFDSNVNSFRVPEELLRRLRIHVLPVSLTKKRSGCHRSGWQNCLE